MKHQIPTQRKGAESIAVSTIILETEGEAKKYYQTVKQRFLDINSWELFAGEEKAEFNLRDEFGNIIFRQPKVGDLVSIKVPLLHNQEDDSLDWVKVELCEENISENEESFYIRLRPTSNPTNKSEEVTHFLGEDATSNFIIKRERQKITAEIIARNEVPNTEDKSILEKIRNRMVAFGGMIIGSKIQWDGLTGGLIRYKK
jgi:hypothetical protein